MLPVAVAAVMVPITVQSDDGVVVDVVDGAEAAAEPQRLGGEALTRERFDWKRWALWGSLVLGVVVLGWMALRLGRQMSRPA